MKATSGVTLSPWVATGEIALRPKLAKHTKANVCVVGAGIVGMTTAYLLARAGKSVVVLDDGPIGGGMTSRTTAHLVTALDDRYFELEKLHGEKGARLAAESHRASIDQVESIVKDEKIDCELSGLMVISSYLLRTQRKS
jgi:glycine/D-amino acid oxidase-like deaminating enzyme